MTTTLADAVAAVGRLPAVAPCTIAVACEVIEERKRQNVKHSERSLPDGTGHDRAIVYANALQRMTDNATGAAGPTWAKALLETVAEALSEKTGSPHLRTKLIELAATCQQWVENIDHRAADEPEIPRSELRWGPGRGLTA